MILSVEKLSHSYGVRTLFKDVTFNIEMGDKIGIIGVNGTGKSTLLRDIARGEAGDGGRITANGSCVIEYLPQNPDHDPQATVLEQVFQGDSPQLELLRRYERAAALAAADPENSALQSRLLELQQQMDSAYAWQLESEAKAVLDQLGISDFNQPMAELSGGVVRTGACTQEPKLWAAPHPRFRVQRTVDLLGMDVEPAFCADTLERLGCGLDRSDGADWKVTTPSWRSDLSREVDLIEEIARVKGMDTIPETLPAVSRPLDRFGQPESRYGFLSRMKAWGRGLGLNEAENYSFVGHKDLDHLGLSKEGRIDIINPLTEEQNVLRTEIAPSLLQNVRTNIAHGNMGVRLFEVANVFEADPASQTTAKESARLGMVMYGSLYDTAWPNAEIDAGYADIRGLVEHFAAFLNLSAPVFTRDENTHPFLAPCVRVTVDGKPVGVVGQVKAQLADAYHARKPIWLAELDLENLWDLHRAARIVFKALSVFPASSRDVTVIAPLTLSVAAVEKHIRDMRIAILEDVTLIDLYEPKDTEERNLTFRLTFRKADRTLKDAEVDKEREKVAQSLIKNLGVRI